MHKEYECNVDQDSGTVVDIGANDVTRSQHVSGQPAGGRHDVMVSTVL